MQRATYAGRRTLFAVALPLLAAAGCASAPEWMQNGAPAPALSGRTVDGQPVDLAAERGKVAVVVFFMDNCPHCRALYSAEHELATRMNGNPFVLIGVDGGDTAESLRDAEHRERISWPVAFDRDGSIAGAWGVTGVPTLYVVDAAGVIRGFGLSGSTLFSTVDGLIAKTKSTP